MIELLLKIILLFSIGFGMGAIFFEFIFSKREKKLNHEKEVLIQRIETLNEDVRHLKKRISFYTCYSAGDIRQFSIREYPDSFDVILKIIRIAPYREETIVIKHFYIKDDIEYAKLCAQELLDELNKIN